MAEKIKPFEKIFPYISYRWKYDDGEYSPYAPFTEVQFVSKPIDSVNDRYEKGFNIFMVNDIENIVLNNIPKGREDVVAVDVLYTESISSTVYILKTVELDPGDRGNGFLDPIIISKRALGIALPDSELTRQFDSVPLTAKAQEFTANRLMYGNYLTKFDQGKNDLGGDGFKITTGIAKFQDPISGPSVKTNRTYDVGVVYMDKYGRQGGLLSQKAGSGDSLGSSLIKTKFTYDARVKLAARINSKAPPWAVHYKYYIKDVSTDFYNMAAFNTYLDGEQGDDKSANIYLQFDSKDRNKITEDSFLIPRRNKMDPESSNGSVITELSRIPVLAIENEAPDIVKGQVNERVVVPINVTITDEYANTFDHLDNFPYTGVDYTSRNHPTAVGDTEIALGDSDFGFGTVIAGLNSYIQQQDPSASTLLELATGQITTTITEQIIDVSNYGERLVARFESRTDPETYDTDLCLVDSIRFTTANDNKKRNMLIFTISTRLDDDGNPLTGAAAGTGLSKGNHSMDGGANRENFKFYKLGLSETGQKKLKGSFFVKVPRRTDIDSFPSLPIGQTELDEKGDIKELKFIDFETEAGDDSNLNLYWEASKVFSIETDHGENNVIPWTNCIATLGGQTQVLGTTRPNRIYLESIKIQDKFNSTSLVKGIRVNTPEANYAQERREHGIIFSGLYNSRTGINELNKFNLADGITKELEPNYAGIQKMHALDTNLLAFCEDKVFKILADKDALFNADEGVNVTATNLVLGQAMAYQGDYGISTHPESFAYFGNNIYFTDAKRGVVMQLTPANGQLFPISSNGMSNFFRDRIGTANKLIGAYDGAKKLYVISMQGYDETDASIGSESLYNESSDVTLGYSLKGQCWTSRYSFIPETGLTLNNKFYTFKNGKIYLHNSDAANRNNFYGVQYNSEVQVIFNDSPTVISEWLSMNYEGSQDWRAIEILADQEQNIVNNVRIMDDLWFLKEGKYYGSIVGVSPVMIIQPGSSPNADGFYPLIQDTNNTQPVAGVKGFFAKVRFSNSDTEKRELFAITTEYYISQT